MKKFLVLISKGHRKQENFYDLSNSKLQVDEENHIFEKNIYKYYKFDSDFHDSAELDIGLRFNKENARNSLDCPSNLSSTSHSADLFALTHKNDLYPVKNNLNLQSSVSLMPKSNTFTPLHETLSSCVEEKMDMQKSSKSQKNLYVIKINNSKNFHIGSQNLIQVKEKQLEREIFHSCGENPSLDDNSFPLKNDLTSFLDCEEKLSEKHIMLISKSLNECWKDFVRFLGLEESLLNVLESRNDSDKVLILYDALKHYLNLFPNTSLGFVINVLSDIHEDALIKNMTLGFNNSF